MSTESCIFCKIAAGQIPSTRVYEDDLLLAFLDIGPIVKGHTLVIPKAHYDPITAVPPALLGRLMAVAQKIVGAMQKELGADGVNLHQANGAAAGQVVPHMHLHIIPRFNDDGHHWNWKSTVYRTPAEAQALAERLRAGLS